MADNEIRSQMERNTARSFRNIHNELHRRVRRVKRRTLHESNRMQMRKILCSLSLALDSAHVKCSV